jgi:hypothetical protein
METTQHPFEKAGLGKAPFRYVGIDAQDLMYGQAILNRAEYEKTGIAVTTKPGGSCAYCGNYIVNMYNVLSSDGRKFHVGSECVNKTNDAKLIDGARKDKNAMLTKRRQTKAKTSKADAQSWYDSPAIVAWLVSQAHPSAFYAGQGKTLRDYYDFILRACGDAKYAQKVAELRRRYEAGNEQI